MGLFLFSFTSRLPGEGWGVRDKASLAVFCSKVLFTKGREEGRGRWLIVLFCSPLLPSLSPLIELGVLKEGKGLASPLLLPREGCGCGGGKRDEKNTKSLSQTRWLFPSSGAKKTPIQKCTQYRVTFRKDFFLLWPQRPRPLLLEMYLSYVELEGSQSTNYLPYQFHQLF